MPQKKDWAVAMDEEARALHKRFDDLKADTGMGQAEFARLHKVPGGPSMVSQHIKGRRPMNLEAAAAYAEGFGVPLELISPRIARSVAYAKMRSSMVDKVGAPTGQAPVDMIVDGAGVDAFLEDELPIAAARQKRWPFPRVDYGKLVSLKGVDARNLENALLAAAGDLDIDIRVARAAKAKAA